MDETNLTADDKGVTLTATLYADQIVADWIDEGEIEFTVTDQKSVPTPDLDTDGKIKVQVSGGKATITLDGNLAGKEIWKASYSFGTTNVDAGDGLEVDWAAGAVSSVTLEVRDASGTPDNWQSQSVMLPFGGTVEFRVTAKDQHGNGVPGAAVALNLTGGNTDHAENWQSTMPNTDSNGESKVTFMGTYAGYDIFRANVGGVQSGQVRVTWQPVMEITAEPASPMIGQHVMLSVTIQGFQCSTLYDDSSAPGSTLQLGTDPNPDRENFDGWTCTPSGSGPEVAEATWTVALEEEGEVEFIFWLKLDGDDAVDERIGEVEKSLTVTWQD